MKRKHKYPTDTEEGIRTIAQIRALPSGALTDEEFCKAFFDRFEAKALVMAYADQDGKWYSFGRLYRTAKWFSFYRELINCVNITIAIWNWTFIDKENDQVPELVDGHVTGEAGRARERIMNKSGK